MNNKAGKATWQPTIKPWHVQLFKTANMVIFNGFLQNDSEINLKTVIGNVPNDFRPKGTRVIFGLFEHDKNVKGISIEVKTNGDIATTSLNVPPGTRHFNACWVV